MSLETARRVLRIEAQAIQEVMARLDGSFERAVELLFGCKGRVALTGNAKSTIAQASEIALDVSVNEEACSLNLAPTASTTVAMAVGDALAVALLEKRDFRHDDFAALHPAGSLGKRLLRAEKVMHGGDKMPRVMPETPMAEAFHEMPAKKLGMKTVINADGTKAGI